MRRHTFLGLAVVVSSVSHCDAASIISCTFSNAAPPGILVPQPHSITEISEIPKAEARWASRKNIVACSGVQRWICG